MDHGGMDHGGMDHGGMDHGGVGHAGGNGCAMQMTWNTEWRDLCLVFPSWRIQTRASLHASLLAVMLLAVAFEYVRMRTRRLDERLARRRDALHHHSISPYVHRKRASVLPTSILHAPANHGSTATAAATVASSAGATSSTFGIDAASRRSSPGVGGGPIPTDADSLLATSDSPRRRGILGRHVPPLAISRSLQLRRSLLYGLCVAISFFLMLIVMTYNALFIGATLVGTVLGHYLFHREPSLAGTGMGDDKGIACH